MLRKPKRNISRKSNWCECLNEYMYVFDLILQLFLCVILLASDSLNQRFKCHKNVWLCIVVVIVVVVAIPLVVVVVVRAMWKKRAKLWKMKCNESYVIQKMAQKPKSKRSYGKEFKFRTTKMWRRIIFCSKSIDFTFSFTFGIWTTLRSYSKEFYVKLVPPLLIISSLSIHSWLRQ